MASGKWEIENVRWANGIAYLVAIPAVP